jgi:hypothetical protein
MIMTTYSLLIRVKDKMNTKQTVPTYLPAVNRQLEYQAGLLTNNPLATATVVAPTTPNRLWLGTDFTHIIVAR